MKLAEQVSSHQHGEAIRRPPRRLQRKKERRREKALRAEHPTLLARSYWQKELQQRQR